jgi:hypothetical protein
MTAEDLIELLEERPFTPLRLRLDDGRSYEIRHQEMAIVSPSLVAIGVSKGNGSRLAERITHCSISHIVEAEPMDETKPPRRKRST